MADGDKSCHSYSTKVGYYLGRLEACICLIVQLVYCCIVELLYCCLAPCHWYNENKLIPIQIIGHLPIQPRQAFVHTQKWETPDKQGHMIIGTILNCHCLQTRLFKCTIDLIKTWISSAQLLLSSSTSHLTYSCLISTSFLYFSWSLPSCHPSS